MEAGFHAPFVDHLGAGFITLCGTIAAEDKSTRSASGRVFFYFPPLLTPGGSDITCR